jgi:hypothetical protein
MASIGPPPPVYTKGNAPALISILETPSTEKLACPSSPSSYEEHHRVSTTNPCSAFYMHPPTRHSLEQLALKKESGSQVRIYDSDLEAAVRASSQIPRNKEAEERVWPGRQALQKWHRKSGKGYWNPMEGWSKRNKCIAKVLIGLLVVGAMVGLGVGIAVRTHSGVWSGQNNTVAVGHT